MPSVAGHFLSVESCRTGLKESEPTLGLDTLVRTPSRGSGALVLILTCTQAITWAVILENIFNHLSCHVKRQMSLTFGLKGRCDRKKDSTATIGGGSDRDSSEEAVLGGGLLGGSSRLSDQQSTI